MTKRTSILENNPPHPSGVSTDRYVQSLEERGNASRSTPEKGTEPDFNRPVGIAGAGMMGVSITAAFLRKSIPVLLYDPLDVARQTAPERILRELAYQLSEDGIHPTEEDRQNASRRITELLTITPEIADLDRANPLLETIVEKSKVKRKFYRNLDAVCSEPKILLSNTSTIRITELALGLEGTTHLTPDRFCGFHFFHPVRKRSLVEVIRGDQTSPETIHVAAALGRRIEKSPLLVSDGPGFLVNRLLNPYLEEAMTLLLEGVDMDRIERVCHRFGMEMGPFRIMDEIGLDVTFHSGWTFFKNFPDYIRSGELLPAMIESGRLGRKNGRGFRIYHSSGQWEGEGEQDETLPALLERVALTRNASSSPCSPEGGEPVEGPEISDEMIATRIFTSILMEAIRAVEAGIVPNLEEADRALDFGLGFPKARGGIAFWADSLGLDRLIEWGNRLARINPKFLPPPLLITTAKANRTLVLHD